MDDPESPARGSEEPYVPASQELPEITVKSVLLGVLLSVILAGANAYLGLKVGMTVSASIPAAVISMGVLRRFRRSNVLENNIVQTTASAGESLAAGVIFTLPALIMLQYWQGFEYLPTMAIALCGGTLGVLYTIPLRRALIVEAGLQFPEGVATAEVLKVGAEGGRGARLVAIAALAGGLLKFFQSGLKLVAGKASGAFGMGGAVVAFGSELGVALLGVGYIVGINIAILVFAGGLLAWGIGIPLFTAWTDPALLSDRFGASHGYELAERVWSAQIRYVGVGAMATGGLWALTSLLGPIRAGIRSSLAAVRAAREDGGASVPRTERDTPIHIVLFGTLALTVPILVVFLHVVDRGELGIEGSLYAQVIALGVVFALCAGFLFSSVAGYMAGLVGSSNNPISGVTIATVLTISLLLLWLLGDQIDFSVDAARATAAAASAILVGGVVCCAAAIAGDNMQDLKAGRLVGATPVNQQIMQTVGVVAAAITLAPVLQLLFSAYGLGDVFPRAGMNPSEALRAPQATLMSSVARGVLTRDLPWNMIWIGVGVAAGIIALDRLLEQRGSRFRTPVLAVAVGIYLPIELSTPIFLGGLVSHASRRAQLRRGEDTAVVEGGERSGLLFASGLITGEALVGIALAIPFAAAQSTEVLSLAPAGFAAVANVLGVLSLAAFMVWLYRTSQRSDA